MLMPATVTKTEQCVCGKGLICVDVHEGTTPQGVKFPIEDQPVPCPACGSGDLNAARGGGSQPRRGVDAPPASRSLGAKPPLGDPAELPTKVLGPAVHLE